MLLSTIFKRSFFQKIYNRGPIPITVSSSPIVPQLTKFLKCARKFRFMLTNHLTKKKKETGKRKLIRIKNSTTGH